MGKVPKLMHVNTKQSLSGGLHRMKRRESLGGTLSSNGGLPTRWVGVVYVHVYMDVFTILLDGLTSRIKYPFIHVYLYPMI